MPNLPDAIVLCGGAGLRLREITGNGPKSMAEVRGRPFLELLLRQLRRNCFERAVLAVGYQQNVIRSYFGEQAFSVQLVYSAESSPLGTGGALRNAACLVDSDAALIMNGDSYTDADLAAFVADHYQSTADVSLLVVPADGRNDCGTVRVKKDGSIAQFHEKQPCAYGEYVNAGVYMVSRRMIHKIRPGVQISLEQDLFRQWLCEGRHLRASIHLGTCVDIGTPARYQTAQEILADVELDTLSPVGGKAL